MTQAKTPAAFLARLCAVLCAVLLFFTACGQSAQQNGQAYSAATMAMDTLVTQEAYGPAAQDAMRQVNLALAAYEDRLSLYKEGSDIQRVNAAAGQGGAEVTPETAALLRQTLSLSAQSEGAFAASIAPLTLAWGITSDTPRIVPQAELDTLLPLVDDAAVVINGNHVTLPKQGMGFDLGGIAKGAACSIAAQIYEEHGVESAYINIGGNVYAKGTKPDGKPFRIGFADPDRPNGAYIATFSLTDAVVAVSGGYERYAEIDGQRYIHIIDPRTGKPAESDIRTVGVIREDGAEADFYSTTLFVWGKQRALQFMRQGGAAILLDKEGNLYVSESLRDSFVLNEEATGYTLHYVAAEGGNR